MFGNKSGGGVHVGREVIVIGTVVRINGRIGPLMVVNKYEPEMSGYQCIWFTTDHHFQTAFFHEILLEVVRQQPTSR